MNLRPDVCKELLDYQVLHVLNLVTALSSNKVIIDGSDTGTGKTYTSIALCKQMKLTPFIICPKTLIDHWKKICEIFNVKPLTITNYESIKNGKICDASGNLINSKYLRIDENYNDEYIFRWNLPTNVLLIFDEVHKCKNSKSINGKLLLSAKNNKILMTSATISDCPKSFHIFGYMLGFYNTLTKGRSWINGRLREDKNNCGMQKYSSINRAIYPLKGSRMRIAELGDKFPQNQISADCYYLEEDDTQIINKAFRTIKKTDTKMKSGSEVEGEKLLKYIMESRILIEKKKIPIFKDLIDDYLENNKSVVVLLNFKETIYELASHYKYKCILTGDLSQNERSKNIEKFQNNEVNLIICSMQLQEGIGLHDLHGVQRVSLISPPFSSIVLQQALGRIYRAGLQTPALQRIIFCGGTVEEIMCNQIREKLSFTSKLNDNDLILF